MCFSTKWKNWDLVYYHVSTRPWKISDGLFQLVLFTCTTLYLLLLSRAVFRSLSSICNGTIFTKNSVIDLWQSPKYAYASSYLNSFLPTEINQFFNLLWSLSGIIPTETWGGTTTILKSNNPGMTWSWKLIKKCLSKNDGD